MTALLPHYTHIVNPKLKHTYLSFDEYGELLIKSPGISRKEIETLLIQKSGWIRRAQKKLQEKKGYRVNFNDRMTLYYLGQSYPLKLEQSAEKVTRLHFDTEAFTLHYHTYQPELFQKKIDRFYRDTAQTYIPPLVSQWAETMELFPHDIRFRKTRRQWGSCSSGDRLSFNTMLMKLPEETITYVIIHELAHIRHKHHQKAFWKLIEATMPAYKEQVAILNTYTPA